MRYLITDKELLDYVSGRMEGLSRKQFERKAIKTGQSDLLLYAQLADYAATGTSTDDIIGEDTFMQVENGREKNNSKRISFPKVAEHTPPNQNK